MPYKKKRRVRGAPSRRQEGQSKISSASNTRRKRQRGEPREQQKLFSSTLVFSSHKNGRKEEYQEQEEEYTQSHVQAKRAKTSPCLAKESSPSTESSSSEVSWSSIRRSIDRLKLSCSSSSFKSSPLQEQQEEKITTTLSNVSLSEKVNKTEEKVECGKQMSSNVETNNVNVISTVNTDNKEKEEKEECERSRSASPEILTASQDRRADHRSRTSILFYTPLSANTLDYHNTNNNNNVLELENNEVQTGTNNMYSSNDTNKNINSQPLFSDPGENEENEDDKRTETNLQKNVNDVSGVSNEPSMEVLIASEDDNSHYSTNSITARLNNDNDVEECIKQTQRYFNSSNNNEYCYNYSYVNDGGECAMDYQTLETQLLPLTCNSSIDSNNLINSKEVTISPLPHTPSPLPYLLAEMENQNCIEHLRNNHIKKSNCANVSNYIGSEEKCMQSTIEGHEPHESIREGKCNEDDDDEDESVDNRRLTVSAQDKSLSAILHTPYDAEELFENNKLTCDVRLSNELRNAAYTEEDIQVRYSNEYTFSKSNTCINSNNSKYNNNKENAKEYVQKSDLESVHCESVNNKQSFLIHAETDVNALMQENKPLSSNNVFCEYNKKRRCQEQNIENDEDDDDDEGEEVEEEGRLSLQRLTRVLANKPRASPGTMWICLDDDEEDEKESKCSNNNGFDNYMMDNKENVEHYGKGNSKSQQEVACANVKAGKEGNRELEELHKLTHNNNNNNNNIAYKKLRSSSIAREPPIHEMLSPTFRPRRASVASVMRSASKQSMMARVLEQYPYIKMDDSDEENNSFYSGYTEDVDKRKTANNKYTEKVKSELSANLLCSENKEHHQHDKLVSNMESVNTLNTPHKDKKEMTNVPTYILHDDSEDEYEQRIRDSFDKKTFEECQEEKEEKVKLSTSSSSLESLSSPLQTRTTKARSASKISENTKSDESEENESASTTSTSRSSSSSSSSSSYETDDTENEKEDNTEEIVSESHLEHIRDAVSHLHSLYPKRITKKTFTSIAQTVLPEAHFLEPHTFWSAFKHAEYVGEGSFGLVWRCTTIDNDVVAVKSCPVSLCGRGNIEDGLSTLREIAILRFLNEQQVPYVLPLHSAFCVKGNEVFPPEVCKAFEFKRNEKRKAEEAALPLAVQQLSIGTRHPDNQNTSTKECECKDEDGNNKTNEQKGKRKGPKVKNKNRHPKKKKETKADKKTREAQLKECLSKEVSRQLQRIRDSETQHEKEYRAQMNSIKLPKFLSITQDDVLESEWTLFLVTELCDGDVENITRSESVMKGVAFCVSTALEQMHRFGLLHLDLKPSNVLFAYDRKNAEEEVHTSPHKLNTITTTNNNCCKAVKFYLSDFGNCRLVGPSRLDYVEDAYGTFEYMDLRALRDKRCSRATDCFSLGCTLFEMMFGERVYPKCRNPRCKITNSGGNINNNNNEDDGSGTSDEIHDRFCYIEAAKRHITLPISVNAGMLNKCENYVNDNNTQRQKKKSKYKKHKSHGKKANISTDKNKSVIADTSCLTPLQQITLNLLKRNWRERMTIAECRMQLLHAYNLHNVRS